jgi:hypothetical protein
MDRLEWIFCAGMIRSGSTLQYQLASEIVERSNMGCRARYAPEAEFPALAASASGQLRVFKAHVCTPALEEMANSGRAAVVYSYRDIRDVALSAMRKFSFDSLSQLLAAGWLQQAIVDYHKWTSMPALHVGRYEDFVSDVPKEARLINEFLASPLGESEATAIGREFSFERQLERTRTVRHPTDETELADRSNFDEIHLLHHNHLDDGEVGKWRHGFSPAEQQDLHSMFAPWLKELGYPIDE